MATSVKSTKLAFVPSADAAVLTTKCPLPSARPRSLHPIFDPDGLTKPVDAWSQERHESNYPPPAESFAPSIAPGTPACGSDRYLRPTLAKDERLRLSMLWYYTRDILCETEFLSGLQEKARLAQESAGWEFSVIGFLDVNYYTRLAAVGLQLGILPRGETICAHTINMPPGNVFLMPNMLEDWRFKDSPYVESGKLHAYAGAPLRLQTESGVTVGLGSLCVASGTSQAPLSETKQRAIAHLADWIVSDLVQCARVRRQRQRRYMSELIVAAQAELDISLDEGPILNILRTVYPEAAIKCKTVQATHLEVQGREPLLIADLEDGVWEDTDYVDEFIAQSNCLEPPSSRVVRILSATFESTSGSNVLAVASNDFRLVFDDIDLWFIKTCASMISQAWHKRLLNEAIKAKDEFLRGFSHQLRTPIHGILGCVELLAEELSARKATLGAVSATAPTAKSGTQNLYLETIKTSGRDLISIVNSMITLNRWAEIALAERSYSPCILQEVEADLAEETSKIFAGDSRYRPSVIFSCDPSPDCHEFQADRSLLRDSLLPLIVNAIQNTPEGVVTVALSLRAEARELVVDIEDTGRGIRPENQARIFEPYEKVGEHSTGAGLGLTIASKFAGLLNGSVTLMSSSIGSGSHFKATFRNIECAPSALQRQSLALRFHRLPSNFHYIPLAAEKMSPCDHLAKILTQHGFTSSNTINEHFVLIDHALDPVQRRQCLSEIPPSCVAACLSPAPGDDASPDHAQSNLVCVDWPLYTSTLTAMLEEADRRLTEIDAARFQQPFLPTPPATEMVSSQEALVDSFQSTSVSDLQPAQECEPEAASRVADPEPRALPTPDRTPSPGKPLPFLPALTSSCPTALLVDDNAINLRFLQMYCEKRHLPYLSACNGQQAVDIFLRNQREASTGRASPIQLVLMDLQMPVCDGLEATKQIRSLEAENGWARSKLYMVTGQDTPSDRDRSNAAGSDDYLVKPVSLKLLDRHIRCIFPNFGGS